VLELADDEWQSIFQIGATPKGRRGMPETAYGTRAADGAARRACKRLAEQGHIELGYRSLKVGKVRPLTQPRGQRAELVFRRKPPTAE